MDSKLRRNVVINRRMYASYGEMTETLNRRGYNENDIDVYRKWYTNFYMLKRMRVTDPNANPLFILDDAFFKFFLKCDSPQEDFYKMVINDTISNNKSAEIVQCKYHNGNIWASLCFINMLMKHSTKSIAKDLFNDYTFNNLS